MPLTIVKISSISVVNIQNFLRDRLFIVINTCKFKHEDIFFSDVN